MGAGLSMSLLSYLLSLHSVPSTTTIIASRRHLPFALRLLSWFALRFINLLLLSLTDLRSLIRVLLWIKKGRRPNLIADGLRRGCLTSFACRWPNLTFSILKFLIGGG
jgi:hypothetical protein